MPLNLDKHRVVAVFNPPLPLKSLKEKQNKVDEEYQRIFQMRQEYEQTVVEIKKVKDDALSDYRKLLDKVRR